MKGSPFKRNFGIGESESPDSTTPANFLGGKVMGKMFSAAMSQLPGGFDYHAEKEKEEKGGTEFERDGSGNLILDENNKPIPVPDPADEETEGGKIIKGLLKGLFNRKKEV